MQLFREKTNIKIYEKAQEFLQEFEIGEKDFILASKTTYDKYFLPLNVKAHVEYKSKYGTTEPTDIMIDQLLADFKASGCNRIIAIGGGAVIDMAKVLVLKNPTTTQEIFQREIPIEKQYPLIAIPTTCGAGSEVSSVSITSLTKKGSKLGLADDAIIPDHAVLIPQLLTEMPYSVFATSTIDALIHAIESYVSPKANVYTQMFSTEAIRIIVNGLSRVIAEGEQTRIALLKDFLIASDLAGVAFANAGTGSVHAMSYPLSGTYHVTHGEANYLFFTAVFKEYQRQNPAGNIKNINAVLAEILNCKPEQVYQKIEILLDKVISRKKLSEYGMTKGDIEPFADNVLAMQQRLLNQSYVKFDKATMMKIYEELL